MQEPPITPELVARHGLTEEEYDRILKALGREPTFTELGIFSASWNEHCSYKSSKPVLKLFPTSGEDILIEAGEENAGVVDIGDGLVVCFKVESHNHPSAVEPFQGAATGVGGILRDIFTMGARPIALLDSLRFGPLTEPRNRYLLHGVVSGISFYGNCMGVPTVGGEVYFDEAYQGNPLVNVLCVGIARRKEIVRARASGTGNPVYYVGSATGRDGLGGASFASRELTEESERDRPAVQVGDPFTEKLLLEACLELFKTGHVVAIQDMGAAGLTCSTAEMAARGGCGIEIDVEKVPRREPGMIPYEVLLSESQERMLLVIQRGREEAVETILRRWDLHAVAIGRVTDDGLVRVKDCGRVVAEIPARALVDEAPVYVREEREPPYLRETRNLDLRCLEEPQDYQGILIRLLSSPTLASKQWVFRQYDHMVRTNTVVLPGSDAGVVRIKGTDKALALTIDGNGRYSYLDPYEGGKIAVAEAARNLVCSGARPLAITNCLNFGNPEKPEIFWQFRRCVEGMAEACRRFNTPVTGGNVSFYNEGPEGAVYPTPVVGMVGLIEELGRMAPITAWFKNEGDLIILLGETQEALGGSEYLKEIHGRVAGLPPQLDLEREASLQQACLEAIRAGIIHSAHDCSEGGLAIALAECCICGPGHGRGAHIDLFAPEIRTDALLFGESPSRIVLSLEAQHLPQLKGIAEGRGIPLSLLGQVGGDHFSLEMSASGLYIHLPISELKGIWSGAIERCLRI
ncbi:MAG: phosphoribosylformylglycinamidine synthase subunit PurL [Nitrospinae bacterium]|nr:phosphoribosylformylglycinamidine synthase subunit PurL [Nitrospinota bacterium]